MLLLAFGGLLGVAVLLDLRRRRGVYLAILASQWRTVEKVIEERRLSRSETETLRDILKRHASDEPLAAVTTRSGFERLTGAAMTRARKKLSEKEFQSFGIKLRDIRIQLGLDRAPLGQLIHSTREIEGGQWVDVAPPGPGEAQWTRMIAEVVDEAYLYLVYKGEGPMPKLPGAGEEVRCHLWRDEDARYHFSATVSATDTAPPTLVLEHTGELNRTQMREHFRIRHDQSTTVGVLSASLSGDTSLLDKQPAITRLRGRITSLSAGGCALVVHQAISTKMLLRIRIELPRGKPLEVHAKIVNADPISGDRYLLRVEFVEVSEEDGDIIARHVLRHQQDALAVRQAREHG